MLPICTQDCYWGWPWCKSTTVFLSIKQEPSFHKEIMQCSMFSYAQWPLFDYYLLQVTKGQSCYCTSGFNRKSFNTEMTYTGLFMPAKDTKNLNASVPLWNWRRDRSHQPPSLPCQHTQRLGPNTTYTDRSRSLLVHWSPLYSMTSCCFDNTPEHTTNGVISLVNVSIYSTIVCFFKFCGFFKIGFRCINI